MSHVIKDIALAARLLRKDLAFSIAATSILAFGVGAAVAVVTIVDVVFLRPVPYTNPEELVEITVQGRREDGAPHTTSPSMGELRHWVSATQSFSHLAAWQFGSKLVLEDGLRPERVKAIHVRHVTEQYFDMLGIRAFVGRTFTAADVQQGADHVVILGHGYWQRRYGGDVRVVDRLITLEGERATIVGVLPAKFFQGYQDAVELWMPLRMSSAELFERDTRLHVAGRLKPGIDTATAAGELTSLTNRLTLEVGTLRPGTALFTSFSDAARLGVNLANIQLVSGAVAIILFLGAVNIAGLWLARSSVRAKDLMIRASLGAGRRRLFQQLLTETLLLSVIGGAIGLAISWVAVQIIVTNVVALLPPNTEAAIGIRGLATAGGLTVILGLLVGWLPALRLSRIRSAGLMHSDRMPAATQLSSRTGGLLIAIQIGLAIVLVNCAGLMLRSLVGLLSTGPGIDADRPILVQISPIDAASGQFSQRVRALIDSLRQLPQIEAVGAVDRTSGGQMRQTASVDGRAVRVSVRRVVPGYFEALGIALQHGRLPIASDLAGAPRAVVSEKLVANLFQGQSAIGELIDVGKQNVEIIGVVADVNYDAPYGSIQPELYLVSTQTYAGSPILVLRPRGASSRLEEDIQKHIDATAPRIVVESIETLRDRLWSFEAVGIRRQQTLMLSILGNVALLLALVGVFGMTLNMSSRRAPEMAIRLALGETPTGAVRFVVQEAMKGVAVGIAVGLIVTVPASSLVEGLLFGTSRFDAITLLVVASVMAAVACVAAWLPSRQISRLDLVRLLKAA